jgi:anti-anti-sigma factor
MPGHADVKLESQGDVVVVELRGEIELSNVRDTDANMRGSVSNSALGIVIDLSHVTHFDSSALQMLFALARWLARREQRLQLVVPEGAIVARELELAGIETAARVFATVPEAVAELRAGLAKPNPEGADAAPGAAPFQPRPVERG